MKPRTRTFLGSLFLIAAVAVGVTPQPGLADYPDRPIKFVIGFPAGGSPDVYLRLFTDRLKDLAGQPVVVENKPGANAMIAAATVATAKPDGYTVLFAPDSTPVGNIFLFRKLAYDPVKDLEPVTPLVWNTFVLVVNEEKAPVKSVADLTELLRKKPMPALYGAGNSGALLMAELYRNLAGFQGQPVNYRGNLDALNDLFGGQLDFAFIDAALARNQLSRGKIKVLAISSKRRPAMFPDVPTMAESGHSDFDVDGFFGAYLPANTPPEIKTKLNAWLTQIAASDDIRRVLSDAGAEPFGASVAEHERLLKARMELWARMVRLAKIEPQQ